MKTIIGIDIGTTSTKGVLYTTKGAILAKANVLYPLYQEEAAMAEQDPEELVQAVLEVLRQLMQTPNQSSTDLQGVSFSAAMHSLLLLDKEGQPLSRVFTWADNRAAEVSERLKTSPQASNLYQRTGTPLHPMAPFSKIIWLRETHPALFQQTSYFCGFKDYLFMRLFNTPLRVDEALASTTGLFDIFERQWDPEALKLAAIQPYQLPEVVATTTLFRGLNARYAAQTGLAPETPFIIGSSDGALSNLGVGALDDRQLALTIGTSGALRLIVDKPLIDPEGRLFCYILDDHRYILGGAVNNGGIVFSWIRDQLFAPEKETAKQLQQNSYALLNDLAASIPPGSEGLLFLPYLAGERSPLWDPYARGTFIGLSLIHSRAHMLRAALEGIIFNLAEVADAIQALVPTKKTLLATGGFAQSETWRQIVADIFEQPVTIPESFESSCLGAMVLGCRALGLITDDTLVRKMVGSTYRHQPNPAALPAYQALRPIFHHLSLHLSADFKALSLFQKQFPKT